LGVSTEKVGDVLELWMRSNRVESLNNEDTATEAIKGLEDTVVVSYMVSGAAMLQKAKDRRVVGAEWD